MAAWDWMEETIAPRTPPNEPPIGTTNSLAGLASVPSPPTTTGVRCVPVSIVETSTWATSLRHMDRDEHKIVGGMKIDVALTHSGSALKGRRPHTHEKRLSPAPS